MYGEGGTPARVVAGWGLAEGAGIGERRQCATLLLPLMIRKTLPVTRRAPASVFGVLAGATTPSLRSTGFGDGRDVGKRLNPRWRRYGKCAEGTRLHLLTNRCVAEKCRRNVTAQ